MTKPQKQEDSLHTIVASVISELDHLERLGPAYVASSAYTKLDPDHVAPILVQHGCVLHLRDLARHQLAKEHNPHKTEAEILQYDLGYEGLQRRYPEPYQAGEDSAYVKRDMASREVLMWNVEKLRTAGKGFIRHSDELERYIEERGY